VAGAGDLEEDLLLALEDDLAIVGAAGEVHEPVELDKLLAAQSGLGDAGCLDFFGGKLDLLKTNF